MAALKLEALLNERLTMPYNPKTQSNLVVDKPYKEMLKEFTLHKGQTMKRGLELLIEQAHKDFKKETKQ